MSHLLHLFKLYNVLFKREYFTLQVCGVWLTPLCFVYFTHHINKQDNFFPKCLVVTTKMYIFPDMQHSKNKISLSILSTIWKTLRNLIWKLEIQSDVVEYNICEHRVDLEL